MCTRKLSVEMIFLINLGKFSFVTKECYAIDCMLGD